MSQYNSYVFNFSYSFFGGGLKRIQAYLNWFNENGGATFILNHRLKGIDEKFPNNRYCFLNQSPLARVVNYSPEFKQFIKKTGNIDLYYAYGIPLHQPLGRVNWLHIANVLTLIDPKKYVNFRTAVKLQLLGVLMRNSLKNADIISAESKNSLSYLPNTVQSEKLISVNGSDEELVFQNKNASFENIAVTVGTCKYKSIDDVYKIYLNLRVNNPKLKLIIVGLTKDVPAYIQRDPEVILQGVLTQPQVCELLKKAKFYITATLIENSYNAASEGAFLASESYVSDIGPHRELLKNVNYQVMNHLDTQLPCLHVKREALDSTHLQSWDQVISAMTQTTQAMLKQ